MILEQELSKVILVFDADGSYERSGLKKWAEASGLPICKVENRQHLSNICQLMRPYWILICQPGATRDFINLVFREVKLQSVYESAGFLKYALLSQKPAILSFNSHSRCYSLFQHSSGESRESAKKSVLAFSEAELSVRRGNRAAKLTRAEFLILKCLFANKGEVTTKEILAKAALGRTVHPNDRSIDVHISRIRKKTEPVLWKNAIASIRGSGYSLNLNS